MNPKNAAIAFTSLLCALAPVTGQTQGPDDEEPSTPPACLAARTDPAFADFESRKGDWDAQYRVRKAEFHPKLMSHADELGKCVERAVRRDLRANSRTTLGVQVGADGHIVKVAMLDSNHANNLYANCVIRTVCKVELSATQSSSPEVFTFNFNMHRKLDPHRRPWSLDPRAGS